MAMYKIRTTRASYYIGVIKNHSFGGGEQAIIKHEAPGSNNGSVKANGRMLKKITLNGNYISSANTQLDIHSDLTRFKEVMHQIKDRAELITLIGPIHDNSTGRYLIEEFSGDYVEGNLRTLSFTIELIEYRQANIKKSAVNLVNYDAAQFFKELARQRQVA